MQIDVPQADIAALPSPWNTAWGVAELIGILARPEISDTALDLLSSTVGELMAEPGGLSAAEYARRQPFQSPLRRAS